MIERTVYQCEHCKKFRRTPKVFFSKERMYRHELSCYYKLEKRSCYTCIHNIHEERYENKCEINHMKNNAELPGDSTLAPIKNCDDWKFVYDSDESDEDIWEE